MVDKKDMAFGTAVAALRRLGDTSVWSLIVTVMGDSAARKGDKIAGPVLAQILEPVGVRPEALRVALHRLRKDGWIVSDKTGRTSVHRLTDKGLAETRVAASRIYQRQVNFPDQWYLFWAEPEETPPPPEGMLRLGRGMFLGQGEAPDCADFLMMQGHVKSVPQWLQTRLAGPDLMLAFDHLAAALNEVTETLVNTSGLSPLQIATLRMLIVHHWRRSLLKHPDLPLGFFPDGWQGGACRGLVMGLLDRLGRP
ncbi:MAG: PaaX family transcriptional regulator [Rhodobacteraceae bacterium]|nr:PaaX family transcriptional regulator [Paracoccaceae bacterium]